MSKKIVFLADCLVTQRAGIYYFAKQFIRRVINQYPQNKYYILCSEKVDAFNLEQIIVPIRSKVPFHLRIRSYQAIPQALNKLKPDMAIEMAHFGPFNLHEDIDRVTIIHDITPLLFPEWHDRISYYGHKLTLPGIIKKAKHIIVNSGVTKKDLNEYFPDSKGKTSIAYPSILTDISKSEGPNIFGKYFLTVGTVEPRKNYLLLIKAFEKLAVKDPELKLVIVGHKGWKSKPVFKAINTSPIKDQIIFEGYVSEKRLINLYNNTKAFIFSTQYEGFGIPLLEALSFGLPILASDIDICREVCEEAAIYFKDENGLLRCMRQVLESSLDIKGLKEKALERADYFNNSNIDLDNIFID